MQVVGTDDEVKPLARKRDLLKVGNPKSGVGQRAGSCFTDPSEVPVHAEHAEAVRGGRPAVSACPHGKIEQVQPRSQPLANGGEPSGYDGRWGVAHEGLGR
ncbi:uncharacterized protein METZ01_LOCUS11337 [marine metagenome]|uniref:Uncharacterized protein n=1 Tax=marine metagenome TaxID=408172 RepID=A0A381NYF9_9ZZZZ